MNNFDFNSMIDIKRGLIDRRIFVDPDIYQLELEQIFARCWLLLGHESEVPQPHDFITTYMGEDPVILTRKADGSLGAYLNLCRHRGNRVCRADSGNARNFMCPYHGWTYASDGQLISVPNLEDGYFNDLPLGEWGLYPVAQLDSYKGLVFATFDSKAPPLFQYLGHMKPYLDLMLDRRAGGSEVVGGVRRWVLDCNWKVAAENFSGDMYHGLITHGSAFRVGLGGGTAVKWKNVYQVSPGNGHGIGIREAPDDINAAEVAKLPGLNPVLDEYYKQVASEMVERLGPNGRKFVGVHATVFPNFSFQPNFGSLHVWHPKGPTQIEVRDYALVDVAAPENVKREMALECLYRQGPAGTWEQDDSDNWVQVTQSGRGAVSRRILANYQMGLGHYQENSDLPGKLGFERSDINQRSLYQRWAQLMEAKTWTQILNANEEVR